LTKQISIFRLLGVFSKRNSLVADLFHFIDAASLGKRMACGLTTGQCRLRRRKTSDAPITLDDARGASSVGAASRAARTLNRMSRDESEFTGVEDDQRRYFIRIDGGAKSNLSPPEAATWLRLVNVGLGNFGDNPALDQEDRVQVAEPWAWPSAFDGVGRDVLHEVQRQVTQQPRRANRQADDWIGYLIIDVLGLDRDDKAAQAKAKTMFAEWHKNRMLKIVEMPNEKRKKCPFVVVDRPPN
jgi:hypothetical protein